MVSDIDWPATGNWRGERLDARRVSGLTAFTFACQRFERIKRNPPLDLVAVIAGSSAGSGLLIRFRQTFAGHEHQVKFLAHLFRGV